MVTEKLERAIDISDEDEGRRELKISIYPGDAAIHFLASTRWGDVQSISIPAGKGAELLEAIRSLVAPEADPVEDTIRRVVDRFPDWHPTPAMLGFARAIGKALVESMEQKGRES